MFIISSSVFLLQKNWRKLKEEEIPIFARKILDITLEHVFIRGRRIKDSINYTSAVCRYLNPNSMESLICHIISYLSFKKNVITIMNI